MFRSRIFEIGGVMIGNWLGFGMVLGMGGYIDFIVLIGKVFSKYFWLMFDFNRGFYINFEILNFL